MGLIKFGPEANYAGLYYLQIDQDVPFVCGGFPLWGRLFQAVNY